MGMGYLSALGGGMVDNLKTVGGGAAGSFGMEDNTDKAREQVGDINYGNLGLPDAERRRREAQALSQRLGSRGIGQVGQSQFRGDQAALIEQLRQQSLGQGPSLAAEAARQGAERAVSQQQAMLASGRGNPAAMARTASQQASAAQGSIAGNAAMGRAQEQLGALQQLGAVTNAARQGDQALGFGNINAQLQARGIDDRARFEMLQRELQTALAQQQGGQLGEQLRNQRFGMITGAQQTPGTGLAVLGAAADAYGSLNLGK